MSKRVADTTTGSDSASVDAAPCRVSASSKRRGAASTSASCARVAAAPRIRTKTNQTGRFLITSYLQLRESDLFVPPWRDPPPSSHSSFCEEVFSRAAHAGTNEVERTNILAPGIWCLCGTHLLPAFTPESFRGLALGSRIQLQQRNCSRFTRDFSRRSTFPSSQRTKIDNYRLALLSSRFIYLSRKFLAVPTSDSSLNLIVTGGAGFIGSNLTLALQEKFPNVRLTVIDDFRSGDFKNLVGYRGDFVAQNLATLDWQDQFGGAKFDAIFH